MTINPYYLNDIKQNIIIHPSALPMLSPPVEWSETQFGGYLDNQNKQTNLITGSHIAQAHKVSNLANLYKAINTLQSIKFEINSQLLDLIINDGLYLLEKLDNNEEELQRDMTLKIAQMFSNILIYLPVNSDWRTRIYTQSFFITYQGADLTSAL